VTVECPRCSIDPRQTLPVGWIATGTWRPNARGLCRAELVCLECGQRWASALPEAIAATHQVRAERHEAQPIEAAPVEGDPSDLSGMLEQLRRRIFVE